MLLHPAFFSRSMVAIIEPPVASIGSTTSALRSVAVDTHHADTRAWDVLQHAFHHAQTRTQDWHHGNFFTFDLLNLYRTVPAFDGHFFRFQIRGRFVGQQATHFRSQFAKTLRADVML